MPGKRSKSIRPAGRGMYEKLVRNPRFRKRYPKTYKTHAARMANSWAAYKQTHKVRRHK